MPYVSPLGKQQSKPPAKKLPTSAASKAARESCGEPLVRPAEHVAAKELGEVDRRSTDMNVVKGMEEWHWDTRKERLERCDEGVDPLEKVEKKSEDVTIVVEEVTVDLESGEEKGR